MTPLANWARVVLDVAASTATGRYSDDRLFIAELWVEGRRRGLGEFDMSLDEFKTRLLQANQQELLALHRADMVQGIDPDLVAQSETVHPILKAAHFEFVESKIRPGLTPTVKRGQPVRSQGT